MEEDERRNPFDPTTPCRTVRELAGRVAEQAWFEHALQGLAAGTPEHALVLGPPRRGKTSLLNAFAERATDDYLVVRIAVNDTVLHEPQRFFLALLHAAVAAIERRRAPVHPRSVVASSRAREPQRFHLQDVDYLDPALLERDFRSVAAHASRLELKGIVALCDQADLIREDDALLQALAGLIDGLDSWMFVLAGQPRLGDEIRQTYRPLSDRLRSLRLGRLTRLADVREAVSSRVPESLRVSYRDGLTGDTIRDISFATRGEPYRLTLLAAIMWDLATVPGRTDFELTYFALKVFAAVLIAEHHPDEMPENLLEVTAMLETLEELSEDDLRTLAPLVALQGMTSRECALALLCKDGATGDVASKSSELESKIDEQIRELEHAQIVESEGDRFRIKGRDLGRTLVRYRIKHVTDELPPFELPNYGALAAVEFYRSMLSELGFNDDKSDENSGPVPLAVISFTDARRERAGRVAEGVLEGMREADPLFIEKSQVDVWSPALTPPEGREALGLVGWVACVMADETSDLELTRLEVLGLHWHRPDESADRLHARVTDWLDSHREALQDYRLIVRAASVGVADTYLADAAVAVSAPYSKDDRSIDYWKRGELVEGLEYLSRARAAFEARIADAGAGLVDEDLGDCLQRLGFFAACLGDDRIAEEALTSSQALAYSEVQYLNAYNLGYVRALRSQWAAAASLAREARKLCPDDSGGAYMLVFTSRSHGLELRSPHLSTLQCESTADVRGLISAHEIVYNAHSGLYSSSEFERAVHELLLEGTAWSEPVDCRIRLILGWTAAVALANVDFARDTAQAIKDGIDTSDDRPSLELAEAMLAALEGV